MKLFLYGLNMVLMVISMLVFALITRQIFILNFLYMPFANIAFYATSALLLFATVIYAFVLFERVSPEKKDVPLSYLSKRKRHLKLKGKHKR